MGRLHYTAALSATLTIPYHHLRFLDSLILFIRRKQLQCVNVKAGQLAASVVWRSRRRNSFEYIDIAPPCATYRPSSLSPLSQMGDVYVRQVLAAMIAQSRCADRWRMAKTDRRGRRSSASVQKDGQGSIVMSARQMLLAGQWSKMKVGQSAIQMGWW